MSRYQFEVRSLLEGCDLEEVWQRVGTWSGVNHEIGPILSMPAPAKYEDLASIPADGKSHLSLTIYLFGLIPFDRHKFAFVSVDAPNGFHERSSNLQTSEWVHKRSLRQMPNGVEVIDECSFTPRVALLGPLVRAIFFRVFLRRHRRLRAAFAQSTLATA